MEEDLSRGGLGFRRRTSVILTGWKNHRSYKHRLRWIEDGRRQEKDFRLKKDATAVKKEKEEELSRHGTGGAPTAEERVAVIENRSKLAKAGLNPMRSHCDGSGGSRARFQVYFHPPGRNSNWSLGRQKPRKQKNSFNLMTAGIPIIILRKKRTIH